MISVQKTFLDHNFPFDNFTLPVTPNLSHPCSTALNTPHDVPVINQRAAQEFLGHSDVNLTASAYPEVASLQLHDEIAKLPWISPPGAVAQGGAQKFGVPSPAVSLAEILRQLQQLAQATGTDGIGHPSALPVTPSQISEMAARVGIEPTTK